MTVAPAGNTPARGGTAGASDIPFPGWEPFVSRLIHPIKVAVVEALLAVGRPLSAVQIAQRLRQSGMRLGDSNLRYHLNHLVEVGLLKVVASPRDTDEQPKANFYYFAGPGARP